MERRDDPDARYREQPSMLREIQRSWPLQIFGLVLTLSGCYLLFWNEGHAIQMSRALTEGLKELVVPGTIETVFEENNEKLMLVGGPLSIQDPLTDSQFSISVNAVKLKKVVQVYQWYEKQKTKKTGHGDNARVKKIYSYDKDWFAEYKDSSQFHRRSGHHNPPREFWPTQNNLWTNTRVNIGDFHLGSELTEQISDFKTFIGDQEPKYGVTLYNGYYYNSWRTWQPQVGDWRIRYSYAGGHGDLYTAVARQSGQELTPYTTKAGEILNFLHKGIKGPEEVFQSERYSNKTWNWIYRLLGWFVTFLGVCCVSSMLDILLDMYPRLRRVLVPGFTYTNFFVSVSLTLTVIGLGWILYRPIVGLAMLTLALSPYITPGQMAPSNDRERHQD